MLDPGSDADQLQNELSENPQVYQHGRFRSRRWYEMTPGAKVMLVGAGVLWLLMIGATMRLVGSARDLEAVGVFVVMGLEGLGAIGLSRVLWRRIGAGPRQALRFAARFWFLVVPAMLLVVVKLAAPSLVAREQLRRVSAGATPEQAKSGVVGATRGDNWQMLLDDKSGYRIATHPDAMAACQALPGQWRLPLLDELPSLRPTPRAPERLGFWLAERAQQASLFNLIPKARPREPGYTFGLLMDSVPGPTRGAILCIGPPGPS